MKLRSNKDEVQGLFRGSLDYEEIKGAQIARAMISRVLSMDLDYLLAGRENDTSAKQGSDLQNFLLTYPLRVMLSLMEKQSIVSPGIVSEATKSIKINACHEDRVRQLINEFKEHLRVVINRNVKGK